MNDTPFSIVLVNYKTHRITEICLNLLKAAVGNNPDVTVWVVDNYSNDASTEYLRKINWINLIERPAPKIKEEGFMAHGRALDIVLEQDKNDYLYLLHTDTLIHKPEIFSVFLEQMQKNPNTAVIGCLEQIDRGYVRRGWRLFSRYCAYHFRSLKRSLGLNTKEPKPYKEAYLKSFFALWNTSLLRKHQLTFSMNMRTPGYEAQDQLQKLNYKLCQFSVSKLFRYMDHVEAATVSAQGGYDKHHRRTRKYVEFLNKFEDV